VVLSVLIVLGLAIGLGLSYQSSKRLKDLSGIRLGMSPVELTLMFGLPDIKRSYSESNEWQEQWVFNPGLLSTTVNLTASVNGERSDLSVSRVCVRETDKYPLRETELIRKLGQPTRTSIHSSGTKKWISFRGANAAFEIQRGSVIRNCLSIPGLVYRNEYEE
jgi:hypothetical protein